MRQLLFEELFVGALVSTIVLGFFDDVASIAEATSFSYIFLAASSAVSYVNVRERVLGGRG